MLGLYSLDASRAPDPWWQPKISPDTARCPPGITVPASENHRSRCAVLQSTCVGCVFWISYQKSHLQSPFQTLFHSRVVFPGGALQTTLWATAWSTLNPGNSVACSWSPFLPLVLYCTTDSGFVSVGQGLTSQWVWVKASESRQSQARRKCHPHPRPCRNLGITRRAHYNTDAGASPNRQCRLLTRAWSLRLGWDLCRWSPNLNACKKNNLIAHLALQILIWKPRGVPAVVQWVEDPVVPRCSLDSVPGLGTSVYYGRRHKI